MPDIIEQRKLAAIMFTDMVGYSALSQRDDKLAQELLEEHRRLLREIFPRFHPAPRSRPSVTLSSSNSAAPWKRRNAPLKSSAPWPSAIMTLHPIGELNLRSEFTLAMWSIAKAMSTATA
jgi:hypothetical protein